MSPDTKHTPGPWMVGPSAGGIIARCPKANPELCHACDDGGAKFYGGHLVCESVSGPDAVLIAAAPDLLAALEDLLSLHQKYVSGQECYLNEPIAKRAAAALAKAKGKP